MAKTYKDMMATAIGARKVQGESYGFVLCRLNDDSTVTAICDADTLPSRGEEIAITESTEGKKKQYRVW